MRRAGGLISEQDLADFTVTTRPEEPARYRDLSYVTGDDPVGREVLGILAHADLSAGPGSADHHHWLVEACSHALIDNVAWYGDPDLEDAPVTGLASAGFAAAGGEQWPLRSACLKVVADQDFPLVDLRVDEHPQPLAELRRLWDVYRPSVEVFRARALTPDEVPT